MREKDLFPVLPTPVGEICTSAECLCRKGLPKRTILRRAGMTLVQVLFMLVCAAFLGGNLALKVHAQGNTRDINTTQIAVHSVQLEEVFGQLKNMQDHEVSQDTLIAHIESEISIIQGMGIAFPAFFIFLQVIQIMLGRKAA